MNPGSVSPRSCPVKRSYDASRRRERARLTQSRVVDVAEAQFRRDGYGGTTVAAVAEAAGVSPESIYKAFGGKAGLVREIYARRLAGAGPVPAPERSDVISAQERDARALLWHWSRFTIEVAPVVSPVMLLVRAAADIDAEGRVLLEEMNEQRLERMTHNARRLLACDGLRSDLRLADARDVLFTYTAPELYEVLVLYRRWSLRRYADFVYHGMCGQLLAVRQ